jgi:hypothetical protein
MRDKRQHTTSQPKNSTICIRLRHNQLVTIYQRLRESPKRKDRWLADGLIQTLIKHVTTTADKKKILRKHEQNSTLREKNRRSERRLLKNALRKAKNNLDRITD